MFCTSFRMSARQSVKIKVHCNRQDRFSAASTRVFRPADTQRVIDLSVKRVSKRSTRRNDGPPHFSFTEFVSCLPLYLNMFHGAVSVDFHEKDGVVSFWKIPASTRFNISLTENLETGFFPLCSRRLSSCNIAFRLSTKIYDTGITNISFFNQNNSESWNTPILLWVERASDSRQTQSSSWRQFLFFLRQFDTFFLLLHGYF